MEDKKEKLLLLREKIQERLGMNADIRILNKNIEKLTDILSEKKDDKEFQKIISILEKILQKEEKQVNLEIKDVEVKEKPNINVTIPDKILGEVEVKIPEKIEAKVDFPNTYSVDWENMPKQEFPEIKTEKVEFPKKIGVDWENSPKIIVPKTDLSPVSNLKKSVEVILNQFFKTISDFILKVLEYIKQPDKIIINDNSITEFYGNKKIIYKIRENGNNREIIRET